MVVERHCRCEAPVYRESAKVRTCYNKGVIEGISNRIVILYRPCVKQA